MPPLMKCSRATLYASWMPAAPFVEPPASRRVERCADSPLSLARRRRQHEAARAGVDDDRDAVLRPSSCVDEQPHRRLGTSGSLFGSSIEPDTSIRNTRLRGGRSSVVTFAALDADAHEPDGRVPRARSDLGVDRERRIAGRRRIVVVEVVDHLLDAHRVLRRQLALVEEPPHVRVRRGVDVDRERRERLTAMLSEIALELSWSSDSARSVRRRRLPLRRRVVNANQLRAELICAREIREANVNSPRSLVTAVWRPRARECKGDARKRRGRRIYDRSRKLTARRLCADERYEHRR